MSFALWPFPESADANEWWEETPVVPADNPGLDVFASDQVEQFREAFRATVRMEDRCHNTLLLSLAVMSLALARWEPTSAWDFGPAAALLAAILILLKTRVPFDKPIGLSWPSAARSLATSDAGTDWRARTAHGMTQNHVVIQRALAIHLGIALILLATAIVWHAARLVIAWHSA